MKLELLKEFQGHKDGILTMTIYRGILISGGEDNNISFWTLPDFKNVKTIEAHKSDVTAITVLNDNLLSASVDGVVKMWNIKSYELEREFLGHQGKINSIGVIDCDNFITVSDDQTVRFWNIQEKSSYKNINFKMGDIKSVSVFFDKIAVGGSKLIICDKKGNILFTNDDYVYGINFLRFSEDGGLLFVSGSMEKTFEVWDMKNFSRINKIKGESWINYINFYKGYIVVTVGEKIKFLNSEFKDDFSINGHSDEIYSIAIFNDLLISGGNDKMIKVWKILD